MSGKYVSQEYVDRLRNMGAADFTVEFADRHVARFSRTDVDSGVRAGLTVGVLLGVALGLCIAYIVWAVIA